MVKNTKEKKRGFFNSLWGARKEIDPTSTGDFPVSPPPTPTNFDNTRTTADEEINDFSDLFQELRELGIDISSDNWKGNLKRTLEDQKNFLSLVSSWPQLLEEKNKLFNENFQIKNQLSEAEKERDNIIIQRDRRVNITPKDLQNLQNEKKLVEQELSKLQEKLKKAGRTFTQTYLNSVIDNATANLFTKDQLDEAVNNVNNAKILAENNLAALQTDLNNNYLKKGDVNRIVAIAKGEGLIDPSNYRELVKAELVKQSIYDFKLKTVTDQRDFANEIIINARTHLQVTNLSHLPDMDGQTLSQVLADSRQLVTAQTDLVNERITHNKAKGQLTTLTDQLKAVNTTINNVKRKLKVNDLTALPMLPVGTTGLGDLISQFGSLQVKLTNAHSENASLKGQISSLGRQLSVAQQQINEYSDVLKNHLGIDISSPNWKKGLTDELDGKNLKNLIDSFKVSATIITDLQTKLEEEQKQLESQKIFNQQLSLENGYLQQEINDCEVNLLKYFLEQLNLEVEVINKEKVLAKIWELITKPSEIVLEDLKRKIQEQEEIITNCQEEKNYVPITTIRKETAECLKNCGIDSANYQTQISQVISFREVAAFQQQAIKQEISKLKSQENVTKNLNVVLCSLLIGLLIIIIYLRMKMNNSKRKVVK